jgi:predicted kinase
MQKVIMGIGIPGSGKTTVLKGFAEKFGYTYICPDDIRKELLGNAIDQSKNREVWSEAYKFVGDALQRGETVVFDATFVTEKIRAEFINFARERGAEKIQGVYLDAPLEVAKERNSGRERVIPEYAMDRMHNNLKKEPPKINEGFDSIFTLDEQQQLARVEMEKEMLSREIKRL